MKQKRFILMIPVVALAMGGHRVQALDVGLDFDSEWQTDFRGAYNWANLLRLSASVDLSPWVRLEGSTFSIASTRAEPLVDDLQGYSNIDADNQPLAISVLGAAFTIGRSSLFLGVRNVNEDYFTSPITSFFVNSSCGIFPTISANYDIANYPLASWCIHYGIALERFAFQTSLYEGRGHRNILGRDNVFTFSPQRDGVFSITSAEFINHGSNYSLGCAVYYGVCNSDESAGEEAVASPSSSPGKKLSVAPWVNIEQALSSRVGILLQGSVSTSSYCRWYAGVGTTWELGKVKLGLVTNFARFAPADESVTDLTCRIPLTEHIDLQPTLECIVTGGRASAVGLLRLSLSL